MMKSNFSLCFLALLSCTLQSCRDAPLPEYTSEEKIEDELYMVNDIWNRRGTVIVGKIHPLPSGNIACRTPVYKDGSFTAAVAEGRELTFYLHGYDRLLVDEFKRIRKAVGDAGAVSFVKTPTNDLRQWQTTVSAAGFIGEITATLNIPNRDYLFDDHGYSGGARPFAQVQSKNFKPGETVIFDKLSPIPYRVVFSGPGLVRQEVDIDSGASGKIEGKPVTLQKATVMKFTFRTRTRKAGENWIEDPQLKEEIVVCDGESKLLLTEARDGLGNKLNLKLKPTEEGITASFFYFGDENFIEIGEGEIAADYHWDSVKRQNGTPYPVLAPGHRYLLQIENIHDIDLETMFSVKLAE